MAKDTRGIALVLNEVTDASITRTSFLSNIYARTFGRHYVPSHAPFRITELKVKDFCLKHCTLNFGGALYTAFRKVNFDCQQ